MWKRYRKYAVPIARCQRYFAGVIIRTFNDKIFDQAIDASINIFCRKILENDRSNLGRLNKCKTTKKPEVNKKKQSE